MEFNVDLTDREDEYIHKHVLNVRSRKSLNEHEVRVRNYPGAYIVVKQTYYNIDYHLELSKKINKLKK